MIVRHWVVPLALLVELGCGGSSSETPPPLEPDPARLIAPETNPASPEATPSTPGAEVAPPELANTRPAAPTSPEFVNAGRPDKETRLKRPAAPTSTWGGPAPAPQEPGEVPPAPELAPAPEFAPAAPEAVPVPE